MVFPSPVHVYYIMATSEVISSFNQVQLTKTHQNITTMLLSELHVCVFFLPNSIMGIEVRLLDVQLHKYSKGANIYGAGCR